MSTLWFWRHLWQRRVHIIEAEKYSATSSITSWTTAARSSVTATTCAWTLCRCRAPAITAYRRKVREAQKDIRAFVAEHGDVLRRDYWRERDTGVENAPKHDILKDNEEENLPVTIQSIANVRVFDCKTLDTAGKQSLQIAHKKLLLEISKQPVGTEMARAFGLDMRPLSDTVAGAPGAESVKMPDFDKPYVLVHNHPSGLTFSPGDIRQFVKRPNLKLLTAVGNDGTVYCMEKTETFDSEALKRIYTHLKNDIHSLNSAESIVECIREFMKEAAPYGLRYTTN